MNPIQDSFSYLIDTLFRLYMLLVLLRFLFQMTRVDFRNQFVVPVVKLTHPPLAWLRRFVPGLFGIDLSAVVLYLLLGLLNLFILGLLKGVVFNPFGGLLMVFAKMLETTIWVFIAAIFLQAIMSWFMPQPGHPVMRLLGDFTRPILSPIRNMLPAMAGIDFSPIIAFVALNFVRKLLVSPLYYAAVQLM